MDRTEHLLSCLAEECMEVAQRATKAQRFGLDEVQPGQALTNRERIKVELSDLAGVIDMLELHHSDHEFFDYKAVQTKIAKVEKYMEYAAEQGALR